MNKVCGRNNDFSFIREDNSRIIISYNKKEIVGTDLYEWYEIYIYKTEKSSISLQEVKEAILADINAQTDEKILSGWVWNGKPVWLSAENQRNFSEAQRMAEKYGSVVLPLTFKLGETEDEQPVYHTFETVVELDDFYVKAFSFVNQTLAEGWQRKDNIDWTPYQEALEPIDNVEQ